jgi:hypothetical protein
MTPRALRRGSRPAATSPMVVIVVAVDDWMTAVATAPLPTARSGCR